MHTVYLGIGGNIGNKQINFENVYQFIENELGRILISSSIYETPPWGFQSDNTFWNSVIKIETVDSAEKLLSKIHLIEEQFGRKRGSERYSSREMDIDILYFDDIYIETEKLIIPHPRIPQRKFVLVPLNEIAPSFIHPRLRFTTIEMLRNCMDESIIRKV
ncbi:MAG: 2-amino-4-hydroxy-6-hydroxymethyldihydropteridine diphosphokinase [Draconibacterium sp.]|nr:2-amino-4-hydroxy-6-hydroxymethyldihydropteridine diphosphokinase [Draconibacterium sp.]